MKLRRRPKNISKGLGSGGLAFLRGNRPKATVQLNNVKAKELRRLSDWMSRAATYLEQQRRFKTGKRHAAGS